MKKFLSILLSCLIVISSFHRETITSFADDKVKIDSNYAILMDYETGDILFEKNAHETVYPASTTKIWTAYIALKYADDLDEVIEIKNFEPVEGSSMYLTDGERFTVNQLLDALLIKSANDASVVIAEHISGSVEEFCKLMNEEAKKIGANNTNFVNSHGLHENNHYTTPYDMALMAREAMSISAFRDIVKSPSVKFSENQYSEIARSFINTNLFLNKSSSYYDASVDGIKTGTTDEAGKCLVSSAVRDDRRVISAVFKSSTEKLYVDSKTLLDYGFDNFTSHTLVDKEDFISNTKIRLSKENTLTYKPKNNYKLVLEKSKSLSEYDFKEVLTDTSIPIKKGDTVGELEIYDEEVLIGTIPLVAQNDINSILSFITLFGEMTLFKTIIGLIILLGLGLALIGFAIRNYIIIKRRRTSRYNRNIFSSKKKKSRFRRF